MATEYDARRDIRRGNRTVIYYVNSKVITVMATIEWVVADTKQAAPTTANAAGG